jgi:hypothetical protein
MEEIKALDKGVCYYEATEEALAEYLAFAINFDE